MCLLTFGVGYSALANRWSSDASPFSSHLGGGAAWQVSSYGLQRETPDWIRGRVFSAATAFSD
jgi:hypothetical protein